MASKYYYQVHLEIALKKPNKVIGFINISHIPYEKFEEIFKDQIAKHRKVFQDATGYCISEEIYNEHKEYLDREVSFEFDFKRFDFAVGITQEDAADYKKDYYEKLPF